MGRGGAHVWDVEVHTRGVWGMGYVEVHMCGTWRCTCVGCGVCGGAHV